MNPYHVLEINENATDEQVRKAYREQVKKYHPDQFTDNPLKELAQEKLKAVNQAYDTIMKQRSAAGGSSRGGYTSSSSQYSGAYSIEFARVRQMINSNDINGARSLLQSIETRNAEWYFLDGIIALRLGWYAQARESLTRAYQMEPNNSEYRTAYNSVNNVRAGYQGNPYYSTGGGTDTACNCCSSLICADCCCECMGGDLIRCC
jgi:molecular chaperone DnaJ